MKAISLWQPWAAWIALGWKSIETRTHGRFAQLKGERIAIHAAKKFDKDCTIIPRWLIDDRAERTYIGRAVEMINEYQGSVICTALVDDVGWVRFPNKDWDRRACCSVNGMFCLFLKDIQLVWPIKVRGRQAIFEVPHELIGPVR